MSAGDISSSNPVDSCSLSGRGKTVPPNRRETLMTALLPQAEQHPSRVSFAINSQFAHNTALCRWMNVSSFSSSSMIFIIWTHHRACVGVGRLKRLQMACLMSKVRRSEVTCKDSDRKFHKQVFQTGRTLSLGIPAHASTDPLDRMWREPGMRWPIERHMGAEWSKVCNEHRSRY